MDFASFVKNSYREEHDAVPRSALQRLGRTMDRAKSLETLLAGDDPALDPFSVPILSRLADAHREYLEWKKAAKSLRRSLAEKGTALPDGSYDIAFTKHELSALERTGRLCERSVHPNHEAWAASVRAHVEFWRACVELSLAHGSVIIKLADPDHPDAAQFESQVSSRSILAEIQGYNWLAIRRGERAKILEVTLELPWIEIQRQAEIRLSDLGLMAQKRGAEFLVKEFIIQDIKKTIHDILDQKAEKEAFKSARSAYIGLLSTPPLQVDKVLAAYVGKPGAPVGLALLDKKGNLIEHVDLPVDGDIQAALEELKQRHGLSAVVLPITSPDTDRLHRLEEIVEGLPIKRVHDAAISEARKDLSFSTVVSNAIVLGRRAIKPSREWSRVDPISIGLGEYPREVDQNRLREVLTEAKIILSWERRRKQSPQRKGVSAQSAANLPSARRLNSFLKTIRDLRPEMMVDGIVTNITRFGAFVNIGLPTEGMIHVSQLSTEFVEDPAEVVRVGEQVRVRILEVVPEKERIALSLKPAMKRPQREPDNISRGPADGRQKREPPKTRSAALADLDALFKK
ncbi:MAG: S1 RNA-binding domain-containing protein [Proteobacteria bacterium]|nr:S1 RNA-binding domain-containing protein [Pseudomonadota bacterium]